MLSQPTRNASRVVCYTSFVAYLAVVACCIWYFIDQSRAELVTSRVHCVDCSWHALLRNASLGRYIVCLPEDSNGSIWYWSGNSKCRNESSPPGSYFHSGTELTHNVSHWYLVGMGLATLVEAILVSVLLTSYTVEVFPFKKHEIVRGFRERYPNKANDFHPHGEAAAERLAIIEQISFELVRLGFTYYAVSPSSRELKVADHYSRRWYWAKDVLVEEHHDEVSDTDAIVMIDVDYHVNMNAYLATARPIICYTMIPDYAARMTKEYSYRFDNDVLVFKSNGGSEIRHKLWNYEEDSFIVDTGRSFVAYESCQVRVSPDHYLVFLVPIWRMSAGYAGLYGFKPHPLSRRSCCKNGTVIYPVKPEPGMLSLAIMGPSCFKTVEMTVEKLETIRLRLGDSKLRTGGTLTDISRLLDREKWVAPAESTIAATILLNHSTAVIADSNKPDYYSFGDLENKTSGQMVASPLVEYPALVPTKAPESEMVTLAERVDVPAKGIMKVSARYHYMRYIPEFCKLVIPAHVAGRGRPLLYSDVVDHQLKPRQKLKHAQHLAWMSEGDYEFSVKAFQKAETYASPKAPRNISTVPYEHLLKLSAYTLAMKEWLRNLGPFGPGKDPVELTETVTDLQQHNELFARDFSTFDGTVNRFLNEMVTAVCMRWAHEDCQDEFRRLLGKEHGARGRTEHYIAYSIGQTRVTGSPVTADHNTLINMFVSYVVRREEGLTEDEAYNRLGIYYGDDSLDYPFDLEVHQRVISDLCLIAKYDIIPVGTPCPFLGRFFLNGSSICDPWRTLGKLHISMSNTTPLQALVNKARGYIVSDRDTPIVATWCQAALSYGESLAVTPDEETMTGEEWYRCTMSWPQDAADTILLFIELTGLSQEQVDEATAAIYDKGVFGHSIQLPNPPYKLRDDAVINDDGVARPNYGPYEVNSCLYTAVVQGYPDLPRLANITTGGELRYQVQKAGYLVPPLGEPSDEDHVAALANFLDATIVLDVTLPTGVLDPRRYNDGKSVEVHIKYSPPERLGGVGHFSADPARLVELQRAKNYERFGTRRESFIATKFKAVMSLVLGATQIFEVSPAPGYFAMHWEKPETVFIAHYKPGLPLAPGVRDKYEGRYQEYSDFADLIEPSGTSHWVSDIGVDGLSEVDNQGLVMYPIVHGLIQHWLKHAKAYRLVVKWFLDADPPDKEYLVGMSRDGTNPNGIEVYLLYQRGSAQPFNDQARQRFRELQAAYVAGSNIKINAQEQAATTKPMPAKSRKNEETSSPKKEEKAARGPNTPMGGSSSNPGSAKPRDSVHPDGQRDQHGVPVKRGRDSPVAVGGQDSRPNLAGSNNGPVRRVPVQENQTRVQPHPLSDLYRCAGRLLRRRYAPDSPDAFLADLRKLRRAINASIQIAPGNNRPKAPNPSAVVSDSRDGQHINTGKPGVCPDRRVGAKRNGGGVTGAVVDGLRDRAPQSVPTGKLVGKNGRSARPPPKSGDNRVTEPTRAVDATAGSPVGETGREAVDPSGNGRSRRNRRRHRRNRNKSGDDRAAPEQNVGDAGEHKQHPEPTVEQSAPNNGEPLRRKRWCSVVGHARQEVENRGEEQRDHSCPEHRPSPNGVGEGS